MFDVDMGIALRARVPPRGHMMPGRIEISRQFHLFGHRLPSRFTPELHL
jgi:hypothetical protein